MATRSITDTLRHIGGGVFIDIASDKMSELVARVPPHKRLAEQPAHLGLPIGNLSSQFFANVYLDALDQHLKHRLRARLNPAKTILQPVDRGVDFVGHVIKPWRRSTRRRTVSEAIHQASQAPDDRFFETANSYFGLLRQASHSHHDRARLANAVRRRGRCVKADLTKTYRRSA